MSALDNLPPDQRAVLQMVLQRGRSYDEIASLLSIDRAAVRQRALDACDALAPVLPGPESALITDYLLGQLPDKVAEQVHSYLQASEADRAWAEAIAAVLGPLASGSLPEIPVGAPLGADDGSAGGLEADSDSREPVADAPAEAGTAEAARPAEAPRPVEAPVARPLQEPPAAARREPRPSSRRGGAILLSAIGVIIVAVVLVVVLSSGGAKQHTSTGGNAGATTGTQSPSTTATTGTTPNETFVTQLNLTSPTGAKATVGIVQVVRIGTVFGMIMRAQGMPRNTAHNAYAVWLYNSPSSFKFVGFVQYLVGKNGVIDTEGKLPAGAVAYHHLLVTLETQQKPRAPGEVVLSGPFREHR